MRQSKFYYDLKKYLSDYHPELVSDESFIENRSELAEQAFIESSRSGMNYLESIHEANEVLYSGLHFSVYQLLTDIIEDEFSDVSFSKDPKFTSQMYLLIQPIMKEYHITDDFERTSEYDNLYNDIKHTISQHLNKYELQ